jgi:hypothetical protein
MACLGPHGALCDGILSLTTDGRLGKRLASIGCGTGRFTARAGKRHVVRASVGGTCLGLLGKARGHTHAATFHATFAGPQRPLKVAVTLVGS